MALQEGILSSSILQVCMYIRRVGAYTCAILVTFTYLSTNLLGDSNSHSSINILSRSNLKSWTTFSQRIRYPSSTLKIASTAQLPKATRRCKFPFLSTNGRRRSDLRKWLGRKPHPTRINVLFNKTQYFISSRTHAKRLHHSTCIGNQLELLHTLFVELITN